MHATLQQYHFLVKMEGGPLETYRALVVPWSFERKRHKNPHCNTACLKNENVTSVTNCSKALYNYCALSKLSSRRAFSAIEYSVDCLETCYIFLKKTHRPGMGGL